MKNDMEYFPEKIFRLEERLDQLELVLKRWEEDVLRNSMAVKSLEHNFTILKKINDKNHTFIETIGARYIDLKSQFLILEKRVNDLSYGATSSAKGVV